MVFCFWNEQMSEYVETVSSGEVGFRDQVRDQVRPHIVTSSAELLLLVGIQKPGRRPQSLLVVVWTTSLYLNLFYLFKSLCVTWSSVPFTWSDSLSASFYRLLEKKPSKWSRGRSSRQIDAVSSPVQDSTVNTRHLPTFEPFVKFKLLTKTRAEREREKKEEEKSQIVKTLRSPWQRFVWWIQTLANCSALWAPKVWPAPKQAEPGND